MNVYSCTTFPRLNVKCLKTSNSPVPRQNTPQIEHKRRQSIASKLSSSSEKIQYLQPPPPTKIIGVLSELKDDIVSCPQPCNVSISGSIRGYPSVGPTSGIGDIYIEQNGKFIKASKELVESSDFYSRPLYLEDAGSIGWSTALDMAIMIEKACSTISRILLGLLGGASLLKLLLVAFIHISWEAHGQLALTEFYAVLVEISSTLYSIMFPICLVSLFDWLDLASADLRHIVDSLISKKIFLVILIFLTSFLIYLVVIPYNDFIIFLWTDKIQVKESELEQWMDTWKNLTLVYTAMCFVGWMITAVSRNEDLFYLHLIGMKKYEDEEAHLTFENQLASQQLYD